MAKVILKEADAKVHNLDPTDASKLSFLTYVFNRYPKSPQVQTIYRQLKTSDGKEIAKAILGKPTTSKRAKDLAAVYVDWLKTSSS